MASSTFAQPPEAGGRAPARMPVVFVGHGSPMNALEDNVWSRGFRDLGAALPRPRAVLAISAHWYVAGTFLTGNERPATIHDFGGFPDALYAIEYPAPGDPALARRAAALLSNRAQLRDDWGLDHGSWTVLMRMWPDAEVPVVQLSIDGRLDAEAHLALGRALAPLREEGVLVFASGNLTHNLRDAFARMQAGEVTAPPPWASRFDAQVAAAIERRDEAFLARALATEDGRHAHPSPDHYLPLLYAAGAASGAAGPVRFPIAGFDLGSLSMRAVVWD